MTDSESDVVIVGGGVAGRSATIFTARAGLSTRVVSTGESILARNAHVENYPGFPAGVNARLLLDMMTDQAERAGVEFTDAEVTRLDVSEDGFRIETAAGDEFRATYVVAATKNDTSYLDHLDGVTVLDQGKTYVDTDERGRTGVEGLYAAGRLARKPHQAIVAAGHGAEVAVTLVEESDEPFYHDWVPPEGYFTGRGREVPPGVEEIDDEERREREEASREVLRDYLERPEPEPPTMHPSVSDDE